MGKARNAKQRNGSIDVFDVADSRHRQHQQRREGKGDAFGIDNVNASIVKKLRDVSGCQTA
ncbi:hypothetical protein D3C76_1307860 [compost metagenome]